MGKAFSACMLATEIAWGKAPGFFLVLSTCTSDGEVAGSASKM